eukprot:g842.t1
MPRRRGANADAKAANQNHEDSDDDIPTLGRGEQRGCDRGVEGKAFKICEHCHRPFTWRKKWERCWDEVRTCSNACKRERKKVARKEVGVGAQAELPGDEGGEEYLEKAATGSAKSGLSPPTNTTSTTSFSFPTQHTLVGILGNPCSVMYAMKTH